jgi:sugar phosphate isomerase/epimerase
MGMEYISCEPPVEVWDIVEQLAEKNQIGIAVHNHPQPSTYWQPQLLLEQIGQRSKLLGSCADVGHWNRDGLDHLECLRSLEGRIHSLHFKDIIGPQPDGQERHDVIWGQGVLDVKAMLNELKRQHFSGYFTIEYEYNWENSVPDIRQCIDYFNQACAEMGE